MAKRRDDEEIIEETADVGSEPRVYELGFHLDPELPTEEVKKAYGEIRKSIEEQGAIVAEGEPQKIQLAYTISRQDTAGRRDFDSAYFAWIVYEATPAAHEEVVTGAGANKRVIRFIDLVTTKDIARHAVEMRELAMKTPERTEPLPAEPVLGTELDAAIENAVV